MSDFRKRAVPILAYVRFIMRSHRLFLSARINRCITVSDADRAGIALPEAELTEEQKRERNKRQLLLEINKTAANYFYYQLNGDQGQQAREYLENRRLSKETQIHFGLGYASKYSNDLYLYLKKKGYQDQILKETGLLTYDEKRGAHDKFWNRVMFPIMDVNNRVIGFGGRVMGDV